jgi:acylphosphatase
MIKRVHAIYSGRVQGIGFRYTCVSVARDLGAVGWVKNLSDGSVEVTAEGLDTPLNHFLCCLEKQFSDYIKDKQIAWLAATGEFRTFEIVS